MSMPTKLTRSQKLKLQTVGYITIFWGIISLVFSIQNHVFLEATRQRGFEHYDFGINLLTTLLIVPLAGLMAGGTIVYFLKEQMRKLPLWLAIMADTLIIVFIIVIISIPASLIYNSIYFSRPPWDWFIVVHALDFMFSLALLHTIIFWSLIAALTMVVLQVNEKYGRGIFWKLLKGKYYRPQVEERIFMFLDIRGSTTIAERIGHVRWFEFLNSFFNDISEPILDTRGEIYQYVGDEIIVHWSIPCGLENNNAISCFFQIKDKIEKCAARYQEGYGVVPQFKAGLHCGDVTIGEIGKIKKDIVFTGDVLNTTARIQELCNHFNTDLLVSQEVVGKMTAGTEFKWTPVGDIELRGKETRVSIFSVIDQRR